MSLGATARATGGAALRPSRMSGLRLAFPGLSRPVILADRPQLLDALQRCLHGWTPEVTHIALRRRPSDAPALCIAEPDADGTTRLHSAYLDAPLSGLSIAAAVCAIIADLAQGYTEQTCGALGLHCGAVRIGGRLVVLTGARRAGKSTLIARLTAEPDVELFCDDVLPVLPDGTAIGLGLAPRLRLPLPDDASALFRAHVARHLGPSDARYGYLLTPALVPHASRAPLAAIILLDRQPGAVAQLHRLDPAEALHLLLLQTITDLPSAEAAHDTAQALTAGLPVLRLVYADLEEASALLRRAFAGPEMLPAGLPIGPALPGVQAPSVQAPAADPVQVWRRTGGIAMRRHGQSAFLWQPGEMMLWQLNPVALAVWVLLELPGSAVDIALTLAEIFPDTPQAVLRADICALLGALSAEGMVIAADAPRDRQDP